METSLSSGKPHQEALVRGIENQSVNIKANRSQIRFGLRHLALFFATVFFSLLLSASWAGAAPRALEASLEKAIPIQEQPFYPDLLIKAEQWSYAPLGQIRGDSPRETLLNFYAAMANVGKTAHNIAESSPSDPGLG